MNVTIYYELPIRGDTLSIIYTGMYLIALVFVLLELHHGFSNFPQIFINMQKCSFVFVDLEFVFTNYRYIRWYHTVI